MANPAARFVITATDKTKKAFNSVKRSLKGIRKSFSLAKAAAIGFTGYLTGRMLKSVAGLSDGWKQLSAQINLVTTSEEQSNRVREELLAISQRTRTDLSANANLYAKMARATKSLGVSEKDLLEITETIGKAMQISGASTVETTQSLRQLGQALASGVLRGDEFNSMMEGSPRLMQAVADSLGVTIGALREMAANGELTAKKLIEAFKGQGQKIAEEFKVLPKTFGDVFTVIKNDILAFVGAADEAEGASASIVAQMTKHWDSLRNALVNNKGAIVDALKGMGDGFSVLGSAARAAFNTVTLAGKGLVLSFSTAALAYKKMMQFMTGGEMAREYEREAAAIKSTMKDLVDQMSQDFKDFKDAAGLGGEEKTKIKVEVETPKEEVEIPAKYKMEMKNGVPSFSDADPVEIPAKPKLVGGTPAYTGAHVQVPYDLVWSGQKYGPDSGGYDDAEAEGGRP